MPYAHVALIWTCIYLSSIKSGFVPLPDLQYRSRQTSSRRTLYAIVFWGSKMRHSIKILLYPLFLMVFFSLSYAQETAEKPTEIDFVSDKAKQSTVRIVGLPAGGTGFFVAPDMIATNFHVAAVCTIGPISAKLNHKETIWFVEGVVAFDIKSDIAILKIKGEGVPLPLADIDTLQIGETVFLAGYPNLGEFKVVEGVLKDIRNSDKWLMTTLEAYPGNSGSPVLNSKGEIIGIHVGHGYDARPSSAIKALLEDSISTEPLGKWRKRKNVRAYAYYMQGWKRFYIDGSIENAIKDFNQAIELNPDDLNIYKVRGDAKSKLGDYKGAIDDYNHVLKQNPADLEIQKKLDEIKQMLEVKILEVQSRKDDTVVRTITRTFIESEPSSGDFSNFYERGNEKSAKGDYAGAIEDFTQAIKLKPDDTQALSSRASAKERIADYTGAIEDYTNIIGYNPNNASAYIQRAQLRLKLKNFIGAIEDYNQALKLKPDDSYFIINSRGRAKLESGNHTGAIEDFTEAIKLQPNDTYGYNNRGLAKRKLGNYDAAIEDYTQAIKLKPKEPYAYRLRGHVKVELEDYTGAIEDYTQAIELNPEDSSYTYFAYIDRGNAKRKSKVFDEAIEDYNHAIKLKPEYANAYRDRGLAKADLEDYKGAIADYDKAIELNPKYAEAYHNRGKAKEALGQPEAAKIDFEKAKELNPEAKK